MIDLFEICAKTFDVKLPSGKEIKGQVPCEGDYIKITNLENKFRQEVVKVDATMEEVTKIRDKQLELIFKGENKELVKELKGINTRIKSVVTDGFFQFMATIDKSPN